MHPVTAINKRQKSRFAKGFRKIGGGKERAGEWADGAADAQAGGRRSRTVSRLISTELLRGGSIRPMTSLSNATLVWRNIGTGEETSRIGYTAHLEEKSGHMRLSYTVTRCTGEKIPVEYAIQLSSTPWRFGGRRWWFECPLTDRRVLKLHLPNGATKFASRQAYRLPYDCQRETPRYRSLGRAWKARKRLESIGGIGDPCLRPKWMRRKTFDRLMAKVDAADAVVEGHTAVLRDLLFQKTGERLEL